MRNKLGSSLKSLSINMAVLAVTIVVALCAGEFLIRTVAPQQLYRFPQFMFVEHPTAEISIAPNFDGYISTTEYKTRITTNSLGLREPREFEAADKETYRVLSIGDSFTMGVGVSYEDTFLQVLERLFSSNLPNTTIEVINMGVPGYRTAQATALLLDKGLELDPSLIMLNFYVGNDILQNLSANQSYVVDGYVRGRKTIDGRLPTVIRDFLQMNSHLYQMLWPMQRQIFDPEFAESRQRAEFTAYSIYADANESDPKGLWLSTQSEISILADISRESKIPLLVVIIPEFLQVDDHRWHTIAEHLGTDGMTYKRDHPSKRISEICKELGIPHVDLLNPLTDAAREKLLYFPVDGHWNIDGNLVAAQIIYEHIVNHNIIVTAQ